MAHIAGDATSDSARSFAARPVFAAPGHGIDLKRLKIDPASRQNVLFLAIPGDTPYTAIAQARSAQCNGEPCSRRPASFIHPRSAGTG
jgi:hypothetical protein